MDTALSQEAVDRAAKYQDVSSKQTKSLADVDAEREAKELGDKVIMADAIAESSTLKCDAWIKKAEWCVGAVVVGGVVGVLLAYLFKKGDSHVPTGNERSHHSGGRRNWSGTRTNRRR